MVELLAVSSVEKLAGYLAVHLVVKMVVLLVERMVV